MLFEIEFNLLSDKFVVDGLTFKPATVKSVSTWEHHSSWNDKAHKICFCASYFNYDVSQAPSSVQPFFLTLAFRTETSLFLIWEES